MWGPGLCGAGMWGFWWIFPLVGVLVCFTLIVMAFRFLSTGRGFSCMGADRGEQGTTRPWRCGAKSTPSARRSNSSKPLDDRRSSVLS